MRDRNILINFADHAYHNSQVRNSTSGLMYGFNSVHQFNPRDIDSKFLNKNKKILEQPRGCGYWLWKPYFIYKKLIDLSPGEVLFYSDAGCDFVKNFAPVIQHIRESEHGVCPFKLAGKHKEFIFTKRDLFIETETDTEEYTHTPQIMASFIGIRKTDFAVEFFQKYLQYAQNEQLITDSPSRAENYEGFKDHRHDQSIFSLLCKKHKIPTLDDPTQWGLKHKESDPKNIYIWHRRNNNRIKTEMRDLEGMRVPLIVG